MVVQSLARFPPFPTKKPYPIIYPQKNNKLFETSNTEREKGKADNETLSAPTLDRDDGAVIHEPATHHVHDDADDENAHEEDDAPVEGLGVDGGGVGPEGPEESEDGVEDGEGVEGYAVAAQGPAGRRQGEGVAYAPPQDAGDADRVAEHEGADLQGDDGVEGRRAADVDEREQAGDDAGQGHRVQGDVEPPVYPADVPAEGETAVTGEREGLSGRAGVEGDVGGDDEDEDEDGQSVDTAGRDGLTEGPNERVVGRVVEGGVHIGQCEQVGQQDDKAEYAV